MNPNLDRIQITPELVDRFAAYYELNPTWGSLHIVLDDGNIENGHVEFCVQDALAHGDIEGALLAEILLAMTKSQRGRIGKKAEKPHWDRYRQEQVINNRVKIGTPMKDGWYVTEQWR
jgi:hypothetical protein